LVEVVFVPVALVQVKPFVPSVVIVPLVANKLVVVTEVPVAIVKVRSAKAVVPVTVRFAPTKKFAVEVPPANWMSLVVEFPVFVTVWKFGVVPEGQFVPSWRHTDEPFTAMAEALSVVPEAVAKPSHDVEVPFVKDELVAKEFVVVTAVKVALVKIADAGVVRPMVVLLIVPPLIVTLGEVREPILPLFANKLVDETVEAKKFVVVTAVKVAFVPVSVASDVAPSTVNVEVTVDEDVIKPPNKYNSLVVVAPLFVVC
jgi:hypothetical protein